jgi:hypothetical protein
MSKTFVNLPGLAIAAVLVVVPAAGADLSKYRTFSFGSDLPAVAAQIGATASQAKPIHTRPALIQELEWRPQPLGPSTRKDSATDVVFGFLAGALYRIEVRYDRYEIEGLTPDDVVEGVSAVYGPATRPAAVSGASRDSYDYRDEVMAQWEDPLYRFDLIRSPSAGSYRLVGVLKTAEALATAATLEAKRLDDLEAPQREAARVAGDKSAAAALLEKARLANKPRFKP